MSAAGAGTTEEIMSARRLDMQEVIAATGGKVARGEDAAFAGVSTDSRTVQPGQLFFALHGDRFDGHDFVADALAKGAAAVIDRSDRRFESGTVIAVDNTLSALQSLARHMRKSRDIPVIGVTGTNGKTTTKEMTAAVLGRRFSVLKTAGNLNNHIGLPLCIANMQGDETAMVLEMGSNAEGDIRLLCDIGRPDYALVTNVGPAHLEGFGSLETVRKTDLEILDFAGTAVVNADDRFLMDGLAGYRGRVITYGLRMPADVTAVDITPTERGTSFELRTAAGQNRTVTLAIAGVFNVSNALAAAAAAEALGIGPDDIAAALESFRGVPMRLEIRRTAGATIISDVYNANPASMEEAVNELVRRKTGRAIAVLGDMLELGGFAEEAHRQLIERLSREGVDALIAVGPEMRRSLAAFTGARYEAADSETAGRMLRELLCAGDTVLIKGSRGMRMERVLPAEGESHAV